MRTNSHFSEDPDTVSFQKAHDMNSGAKIFALVVLFSLGRARAPSGGIQAFFSDERNDLLRLRDSLASTQNLHSNWTGPPCFGDRNRWVGITCAEGHVVGVALEWVQLTGELPPMAFENVTHLRELRLRGNALRGRLPGLVGLRRLRAVLVAHNRFSGPIPVGLAELPGLGRVELQDNLLNGTIPPFGQSGMKVFNVSYNFLVGPIPGTPTLERFPTSSFEHNLGLCGEPLDKPCPVAPATSSPPPVPSSGPPGPPKDYSKSKGVKASSVVLIAVAAALGVPLVLVLCLLCCCRRTAKGKAKRGTSEAAFAEGAAIEMSTAKAESSERMAELEFFDQERPVFNLDHLLRSSAEVLGKGSLGTTYKVAMESGPVVVKRFQKEMSGVPNKDFVHHMQLLGKTRDENLVEIVSFHCSKEERLVISEYVPGGSLFELLHGNRGEGRVPLNWESRLHIVKGVARGLACLHQSLSSHKVPHGNLKASNVVVLHGDGHSGYHPKLTDFGFLPLLPSSSSIGKLATGKTPEFSQGKKLSHRADVYCFGIIILEVITGRTPSDESGEDLAEWVSSAVNVNWSTDILDLELVAATEGHGDMLRLAGIALECTAADPERRPRMSEVLGRVEEIKEADDDKERT